MVSLAGLNMPYFGLKVKLTSKFLPTGRLKAVYESSANKMQYPYKRHVEYMVFRIAPLHRANFGH